MKQSVVGSIVLVIALAGILNACAMTFDGTTLGVKASVSEPAGAPVQGTEFRVSKKTVYFFWGAVPAGRPSLDAILAGQLIEGSEVANLRIHVRSKFVDLFVTVLTVGLVVPRSVTYQGVIVGPNAANGEEDGDDAEGGDGSRQ